MRMEVLIHFHPSLLVGDLCLPDLLHLPEKPWLVPVFTHDGG